MGQPTYEIINNVPYIAMPDGRKIKYSDILSHNNDGAIYDDVTLEQIPFVTRPPRADAPASGPTKDEYSFGDIGDKMGDATLEAAKAALFSDGTMARSLLPEDLSRYVPPELGGVLDGGLAGLLGLVGAVEKGAGYAAEVIDPVARTVLDPVLNAVGMPSPYKDGDSQQALARDLMGMFEGAGFGPEGRIVGSILSSSKPYLMQQGKNAARGVMDVTSDLISDDSGALSLPPSVRGLFDEATLREGMIDVPDDPNALDFFADRMKAAQDSHGPIGRSVDVYDPDKYAGMRVAMTPGADAGFAIKPDGEVASVVKMKGSPFRDFSGAVLRRSEPDGGYWLNAFDTALTEMYGRGGFRPVSRVPFSEEYARADWGDPAVDAFMSANSKYNGGRPDLVFMARDPAFSGPVVPGSSVGLLTDDYDVATQALEAELRRLGYR